MFTGHLENFTVMLFLFGKDYFFQKNSIALVRALWYINSWIDWAHSQGWGYLAFSSPSAPQPCFLFFVLSSAEVFPSQFPPSIIVNIGQKSCCLNIFSANYRAYTIHYSIYCLIIAPSVASCQHLAAAANRRGGRIGRLVGGVGGGWGRIRGNGSIPSPRSNGGILGRRSGRFYHRRSGLPGGLVRFPLRYRFV
jgi:hypothetical protein